MIFEPFLNIRIGTSFGPFIKRQGLAAFGTMGYNARQDAGIDIPYKSLETVFDVAGLRYQGGCRQSIGDAV